MPEFEEIVLAARCLFRVVIGSRKIFRAVNGEIVMLFY